MCIRDSRDIQELVELTDDASRSDGGLASNESDPLSDGGAGDSIAGEPSREWHGSLQTWLEGDSPFRKPFRPWMYVLGSLFLAALAIYALKIVLWPH